MTSQWAAKRKLLYAIFTIIFLAVVIGVPSFFLLYKTPTCFDGKKNQNEKGVDCGGVCSRLCPSDISAPIIVWQRAFQVAPGLYNAVAYVQNPNILTRVDDVGYVFKIYDKDNTLITEKKGRTFLVANKKTAVFEAGIRTGARVPARTSFEFTEAPVWSQNVPDYKEPVIVADNVVLNKDVSLPRIDATIRNLSLENVKVLGVVSIVYDAEDNAIGASRTLVENLTSRSAAQVYFTWPAPFVSPVVRKEILLQIYPTGIAF